MSITNTEVVADDIVREVVEQSKASVDPAAAPSELPYLMTVLEWREYMRLSRTAAYALVREGAVPVVRIGRHIRIPRSACEAK